MFRKKRKPSQFIIDLIKELADKPDDWRIFGRRCFREDLGIGDREDCIGITNGTVSITNLTYSQPIISVNNCSIDFNCGKDVYGIGGQKALAAEISNWFSTVKLDRISMQDK